MRVVTYSLCFFNFVFGFLLGETKSRDSNDGIYDVYRVESLKLGKECPMDLGPRIIPITYGEKVNGYHNCEESASWSSNLRHVDSTYLCQSPSMIEINIIESVNWDQSGLIGIGTVDVYHYDESGKEICHSKSVMNWIKR